MIALIVMGLVVVVLDALLIAFLPHTLIHADASARDDFDAQIPDAPAQVARETAGRPPCPDAPRSVLAPDNASSEPETDAAPAHFLNHVETYRDHGERRYVAVCHCGGRMPNLYTKEGCAAWVSLHARRVRLSEAWSVDALLADIENGRPTRIESGVTPGPSVPVATRPASPRDLVDIFVDDQPAYARCPEHVARQWARAQELTNPDRVVELRPVRTT